jgi:hypothetical protein
MSSAEQLMDVMAAPPIQRCKGFCLGSFQRKKLKWKHLNAVEDGEALHEELP